MPAFAFAVRSGLKQSMNSIGTSCP